MTHTEPGMSRKVRDKAAALGVHNDCILAGTDGCCKDCHDLIMLSFDFFYGHIESTEEMLLAMIDDYLEERGTDV